MFGDFFRVGQQFGGQLRILLRRSAAWAGAGQRTDGDFAFGFAVRLRRRGLLIAHQDFWRCADNLHVAEIVEIHIRRRIQRAQGAIQHQRRIDIRFLDALADLNLHQVASHHIFLGLGDSLQIIFFFEFADGFGAYRSRGDRCIGWTAQHVAQVFQALPAFGESFRLGRIGIHDQVQFAGQVVDYR